MDRKGRMVFLSICLLLGFGVWFCHAGTEGREIYLSKCGSCHGDSLEARAFAPTKYAASQWERFFRINKHRRKKNIDSMFSANELQMVKDYLVKHAADSDQPEAIGLR